MSYLEKYRSGHNGPDSKSGEVKASVGSNPTFSATSEQAAYRLLRLFFKSWSVLISLLLLFRKRSRSRRLFACKRVHDGFGSLPTFCGDAGQLHLFRSTFPYRSKARFAPAFLRLCQRRPFLRALVPPFCATFPDPRISGGFPFWQLYAGQIIGGVDHSNKLPKNLFIRRRKYRKMEEMAG